jgi:hypothetical protein
MTLDIAMTTLLIVWMMAYLESACVLVSFYYFNLVPFVSLLFFIENIGNFDEQWGSCLNDWKGYTEKPWNFRKNGDQLFEFGHSVNKPEYAQ